MRLTEWRLLQDGITDAYHHFAVEEALARLVDEGRTPPTLRMRRVRPAVFVGVFQNTWAEVDVAYCQAHDIQIVRRPNGGGAVYHELGSFCFSAFFPRNLFAQSDEELYRLFSNPAIRTCAGYGVKARFLCRNDVLAGERKIYGSAQLAWYSAFVQSGTFLVNIDFDAMQRALTPPAIKYHGKAARSIKERVTSLSTETGRVLDTSQVMARFAGHTADVLGISLIPGDLTPEEHALAAELLAVKYSTDAWNLGSRAQYQVTVAGRTDEGVISLSADLAGAVMRKARLTGDMLLSDRRVLENLEQALTGCTLQQASEAVQTTPLSAGMQKALIQLLEKLKQEVTDISSSRVKEDET